MCCKLLLEMMATISNCVLRLSFCFSLLQIVTESFVALCDPLILPMAPNPGVSSVACVSWLPVCPPS